MKTKTWIAIIVVAAAVVAAVLTLKYDHPSSNKVKIGAIIPMTGSAAGYGKWMQRGIELAVEDINNSGGINGDSLNVVIEDSKSDNRAGVDAAKKLISLDRVTAIITVLTGVTNSIIPLTERDHIFLFTLALAPGLTEGGRFIFRNATNIVSESEQMISACIRELMINKVALIYMNNATGLWVADYFKREFESRGGIVTASESFPPDITDFRTQLSIIKASEPEALYILGYQQNGLIMKQARELGLKCQFLGASDCELPDVLATAGTAAENTIYTKAAFDQHSTTGDVATFVKEYSERFHEYPEFFSATTYDALKIIALAFKNGGNDPENIRAYILSIKDYPGISGQTTFLPNGDVRKPVELKQIIKGNYVPYGK